MTSDDVDNLAWADGAESVDERNAAFYGRFPYPWAPMKFVSLSDPHFETAMLNQDLGDWEHRTVARRPRIWIAGCGTNQAVFTALRFPESTVVGSDISAQSLQICSDTARKLGLGNLELREESLNQVTYREEFDYVLSTGVIHHNADPPAVLERIARSLKPSGVLELMVYNRYTWMLPAAFQKAIRLFVGPEAFDYEAELSTTRRLIESFQGDNTMASYLRTFRSAPESKLADALLQPVLHGYTVESLAEMAESCELDVLLPCLSVFDRDRLSWNLAFANSELDERYLALPDLRRWQITNLLMLERSPSLLWFYVQRKDAGRLRRSEREVAESFLDTVFRPSEVRHRAYIRNSEGGYDGSERLLPYPARKPQTAVRPIAEACDGRKTMRRIFEELGLDADFHTVHDARLRLTTTMFPYLVAV